MSVSRNRQLWLRHKTPSVEEVDVPATRLISFRITTTAHEMRMTLIAPSPVSRHTFQPRLLLSRQTTITDANRRIPTSDDISWRMPVAVVTIPVVEIARGTGRKDWTVDSRTILRCAYILSRFQWNLESGWVDRILWLFRWFVVTLTSSTIVISRPLQIFLWVSWFVFSPLRLRRFLLLLTNE